MVLVFSRSSRANNMSRPGEAWPSGTQCGIPEPAPHAGAAQAMPVGSRVVRSLKESSYQHNIVSLARAEERKVLAMLDQFVFRYHTAGY